VARRRSDVRVVRHRGRHHRRVRPDLFAQPTAPPAALTQASLSAATREIALPSTRLIRWLRRGLAPRVLAGQHGALRVRRGCWNEIKNALDAHVTRPGFPPERWPRSLSDMTERIRRNPSRVAVIGFSSHEPGKQGAHTGIRPAYQPLALQQGGVGMAIPPAAPPSGPQSNPDPDHFPAPDAGPQQPNPSPPEPDSGLPEQDGRQK
jgi:hypothetical protein